MLEEDKILKDSISRTEISLKDTISFKLSYSKTNKLIAALYMVTDIIDINESLRNKLRNLGAEIVSDMHSVQQKHTGHMASVILSKTQETLSFLEIACAVGMISEMNRNILKKEFLELQDSLQSSEKVSGFYGGHSSVSDFMESNKTFTVLNPIMDTMSSIGRVQPTRIGVQKGHTLMQALSDRMPNLSLGKSNINNIVGSKASNVHKDKFDSLKQDRRNEIISVIKTSGGSCTITDIKNSAKGVLVSCGEKTLQRELLSMVSDGLLSKAGEKRWSRYSVR